MKYILSTIIITSFIGCTSKVLPVQTPVINVQVAKNDTTNILLGHCGRSMLQLPQYAKWYSINYTAYLPNDTVINALKPQLQNTTIDIFLGTWCGDSRRETPRMLKLLDAAGLPASSINLVFVDNIDTAYKQSPQHEEAGKHIFRVPTFIVYKNGKEAGRIVETPVVSLEQDLLAIASGAAYGPKYQAVNYFIAQKRTSKKMSAGQLQALALAVKPLTKNEAEFNSYGYLLMAQKQFKQAQNVFTLNTLLYPSEPNTFDSLGEFYAKTNNKPAAVENYKKVLQLNPNNVNAKQMLERLEN